MRKTAFFALALGTLPAAAMAQMSCSALGSYLATLPQLSQYVPPPPAAQVPVAFTQLIPASGTNAARCEANFIFSGRGGPDAGYAVGQNQRIGIRVGFPLNTLDGGAGGVQGAWNGKVRNIGGGGLAGSLSSITAATNTGFVGSNTDTGHPGGSPTFAVIQDTHELNLGTLDDFLVESIHQQYKWALALTQVYYGQKASRNYWDGCSTGGREGLSMALNFADDFDGFLTGAPANYHTRLQVATVWPFWVQKELTASAAFPKGTLTQAKMNAANASAVAACDAQDGVVDGVLGDPRACTFDAKKNVCGMPGAPTGTDSAGNPVCLTPQEADAVNRIWDGPRNDLGLRIWFPFGRGANAGVTNAPPFGGPGGSLGIFTWSHRDNNYDFTGEPLSQFDDETQLATNDTAPYSDIISTDLRGAKKRGAKILMWQGGSDQLIPWRQGLHYYREAAETFGGFKNLQPWFRFFLAPGVTHCGGGAGPQPSQEAMFQQMVSWVETGNAPDTVLSSNTTLGSRPMCPYPQTAVYNGNGADPKLFSSWHCGGSIETSANACMDRVARYQDETGKHLESPQECSERADHANN